jgi:hypothetical protein
MTWATVVRDWNKSINKTTIDPEDVYGLPLKGTPAYNTVKKIYEREKSKAKRKEVKFSQEEVLKPKMDKLKKFIEDINQPAKMREKALEGLMKVASETAERNKQRKREAEERKMMSQEDIKESDNLDEIMKISKDLSKYSKLPERVIEFPDVQPKIKNKPGDVMKQNPEYARFVKYLSTAKKRNALNVRRRAYLNKGMSPDEAIREAMNRHPEIEAFRRMEEDEL